MKKPRESKGERRPRTGQDAPPAAPTEADSAPASHLRTGRAAMVVLALCGLFGAVLARAYDLQVGRAADFTREADSQLSGSVEIGARRGAIYDRNGLEMALSVRAESIAARPPRVTAPREAAQRLAPILGRSEPSLFEALTSDRHFVWLARRVSPRMADQIRSLDLAGIDSESEWQRYYPMRTRAGQVLGFTGDDGDGLEGLERAFNATLDGGEMEVHGLRDAHGRPILSTDSPQLDDMEGTSLVLTLDSRIQRIAERELEQVVVEQSARTGVIVVMDPHDGEVLAMASWPPFDPNRFRTSSADDWRDRAVTDAWEPGSTMKIFTYAAAIEAGVITPDTVLDCGMGHVQIGQYRVRDHHRIGFLPAQGVIQRSSNIGAYRIASLLGDRRLYEAFRRFGFGEVSGLGLGGEQAGLLAEPPWAEIELANRAFGQGVSVTPLQLAMAYSAIANGGVLMDPMLVLERRNKDGEVIQRYQPHQRRRVVSQHTAELAMQALESVTHAPGTGTRATIPGIRVAGKTGTAQKVNPDTGQYDDRWMAAFAGIVPADDPVFTILVMIDEPQLAHYGGEVAAPVFERVAEQALELRGIYATRPATAGDAAATASSGGDDGDGNGDSDGAPLSPVEPPPLEAAPLADTDDEAATARVTVPDLSGLDLAEALAAAEPLGLTVQAHDWGTVEHQWPAPGAHVPAGTSIDVYLLAPYDRAAGRSARRLD